MLFIHSASSTQATMVLYECFRYGIQRRRSINLDNIPTNRQNIIINSILGRAWLALKRTPSFYKPCHRFALTKISSKMILSYKKTSNKQTQIFILFFKFYKHTINFPAIAGHGLMI